LPLDLRKTLDPLGRRIQQAADDGLLRLKIMLDNLRILTRQADELIAKLLESGLPKAEGDGCRPASSRRSTANRRNRTQTGPRCR